jgi:hypothetical protein
MNSEVIISNSDGISLGAFLPSDVFHFSEYGCVCECNFQRGGRGLPLQRSHSYPWMELCQLAALELQHVRPMSLTESPISWLNGTKYRVSLTHWTKYRFLPSDCHDWISSEASANFCGQRMPHGQHDGSLRPYTRISRQEPLLILPSSSSIVLNKQLPSVRLC